jgi:hypothetical protein
MRFNLQCSNKNNEPYIYTFNKLQVEFNLYQQSIGYKKSIYSGLMKINLCP